MAEDTMTPAESVKQSENNSTPTQTNDFSDQDVDTFEDAQDTPTPPMQSSPVRSSSRSLTHRRLSSSSTATNKQSEKPTESKGDPERSEENGAGPSAGMAKGSPLITQRRLSNSSLDEVSLDEIQSKNPTRSRSSTVKSKQSAQIVPPASKPLPRDSASSISKVKGFSGALPSMPWANSQSAPVTQAQIQSAQSRKLSSPFSWLSRGANSKEAQSPPLAPSTMARRDTTSSLATVGSNPELMLSRIDDEHESGSPATDSANRSGRNSLRDRFKMLRMREEAGITSLGDDSVASPVTGSAIAGLIGRSTGLGLGVASPTSLADEREVSLAGGVSPLSETAPKSPLSTIDHSLAPGMASGVSAGPSALADQSVAVDWDLWQNVVYEGPAAVARTSPDELNVAIASGIPSAIRGVVWQVLAQSKNEELEGLYKDLVARGTDKDKDRLSGSSNSTAATQTKSDGKTESIMDKESVLSSSSSIHSERSTGAITATNGITSPAPSETEAANAAKLKTKLAEEKKRKAKDELASLKKLEKAIKRDMGARTSFSKYTASAGLQDGLFGVCKAYALYDEGVGYAQGMSFLAMPLLFNMPEEEAFCMLVRLMNHYHLRDLFVQDMPGLHLHLYQFERLLEEFEPALYCHLHRRGVNPQLYATQWFLTLFAYRFPLQLVLRVYDLVLSEGLEGAILKFGVVLMQKNATTLLGMKDMVAITNFLKEKIFDVYIDQSPSANSILESGFFGSAGGIDKEIYRADILVQDACAVKITPEMLKIYSAEWNEKIRTEREREEELESLRSANNSLAAKVRKLEDRTEKHDTEHVHVASELVKVKVENEELKDENETLKGQTVELRRIVDKQPEEIELMLKAEMDRISKRNTEVQQENLALEVQLEDMEKSLVATKMEYAEVGLSLSYYMKLDSNEPCER
ncbi:MAG: GTPase-activating protein [Vezdaea aestivalis]|nr:MAG: GTPase-activating protein [Vezdaea aestivalis]